VAASPSRVHILLVEPPGAAPEVSAALARLAGATRVSRAPDSRCCADLCATGEVDVVVAHPALGEEVSAVLASAGLDGPPVVVVTPAGDPALALEWFRRGAADCVAATGQLPEALGLALLEQIRRRRAIVERGAADRRIRDLERYNDHIIQNMNSALLVVDAEARITASNPPAERILGRAAELLHGRTLGPGLDGPARLLQRSLATGERFRGAESEIAREDGSVVPIGISCAPILDSDGVRIGAVATFQDLSAMRQLQRQVLQSEKLASLGQLAAGVAHEINNPMGFIHANLAQMAEYTRDLRLAWSRVEALQKTLAIGRRDEIEAAAERLATTADEVDVSYLLSDLAKAIRESQEGSERIRHIVSDLRDFSHQDTGERVPADVNQCLESTANIVWPMMKHLVVLEKEYQELPAVNCFPMQLKQVFMNLLVNAFQSIEERLGSGGGSGRVGLRTRRTADGVEIQVEDDGIGVAPENLGRLFDPFFTTKKVGMGTGLGLSTSYSIVRRHGGTIRVEGRPGQGALFRVLLPLDGGEGEADGS
jgi:PAS domain S-box-containing protein